MNCSPAACQRFCADLQINGQHLPASLYKQCSAACANGGCRSFCGSLGSMRDQTACQTGCGFACSQKLALKTPGNRRINTDFTVTVQIGPIIIAVVILVMALALLRKKH